MANPSSLKPFTKGDPRINRKGRPKSFDALRSLAQQIAHEVPTDDKGQPLVIDDHFVTTAEAILRAWSFSPDAQLQKAFIEYAYGKVPQPKEIELKVNDLRKLDDADLLAIIES